MREGKGGKREEKNIENRRKAKKPESRERGVRGLKTKKKTEGNKERMIKEQNI